MASDAIQNKAEEEVIEIDETPDKIDGGTVKVKGRKGQTIQKNYVLNDSSALKKKKRNAKPKRQSKKKNATRKKSVSSKRGKK